jgi:hypothetical protein
MRVVLPDTPVLIVILGCARHPQVHGTQRSSEINNTGLIKRRRSEPRLNAGSTPRAAIRGASARRLVSGWSSPARPLRPIHHSNAFAVPRDQLSEIGLDLMPPTRECLL